MSSTMTVSGSEDALKAQHLDKSRIQHDLPPWAQDEALSAHRKHFTPEHVKVMDDEQRTVEFVITNNSVDRDGDILDPKGWNFSNFLKNPVVLFGHNSTRPPIGRALDLRIEGNKVISTAEFMDVDVDTSGFSDMIYRMIKGNFLRAVSVGFLARSIDFIRNDDDQITGIMFLEQELLEYSVVPIPANAEALRRAKSQGINLEPLDTWFEEALDNWTEYKGLVMLPKKEVEAMKKELEPQSKTQPFFDSVTDDGISRDGDDDTDVSNRIKTVITYSSAHSNGTPTAPRDAEWNGSREIRDADVRDLLVMSAWRESKPRDELNKSDFKLPHHRASDRHSVVWRGVVAAMASLLGARGGVEVPDGDRRGIYRHLARHYRDDFNEEPPEFRHVEEQTLAKDGYVMNMKTGQVEEKTSDGQKAGHDNGVDSLHVSLKFPNGVELSVSANDEDTLGALLSQEKKFIRDTIGFESKASIETHDNDDHKSHEDDNGDVKEKGNGVSGIEPDDIKQLLSSAVKSVVDKRLKEAKGEIE